MPRAPGVRDPWVLEGQILALLTGLEQGVMTIHGLDTLIPWLMLVHKIAEQRTDKATMQVAFGMLRTCHEIYDRRILVPGVMSPDEQQQQQVYVSDVHKQSLESVLPTLIDFIKKAKNSEIMQASTALMKEHGSTAQ